MADSPTSTFAASPVAALLAWLGHRLDASATRWLEEAATALTAGGTDRDLFRSVSLAARKLGKAPLAPDGAALAEAARLRPGWDPSNWTVDQAGRVCLLLACAGDTDSFVRRLDQLFATADLDELIAFYRGLPLYPDPPRHRLRAAEGVRSNMRAVFEAVAHRNPYPAEQLAQDAWNQMVLKALFVGSTLDPIIGLDDRANSELARMLCDYAHERWAAGRPVSAELWRCVGPFAEGAMLADLDRVLGTGSPTEQAAAVLALRRSSHAGARQLLERHRTLDDSVRSRGTDWRTIAEFH